MTARRFVAEAARYPTSLSVHAPSRLPGANRQCPQQRPARHVFILGPGMPVACSSNTGWRGLTAGLQGEISDNEFLISRYALVRRAAGLYARTRLSSASFTTTSSWVCTHLLLPPGVHLGGSAARSIGFRLHGGRRKALRHKGFQGHASSNRDACEGGVLV